MILQVDDGELYYETEGEGIPCVIPVPDYQGYLTRTLSESLRQRSNSTSCTCVAMDARTASRSRP